jgi:hypothetical protein
MLAFAGFDNAILCVRRRKWGTRASGITLNNLVFTIGAEICQKFGGVVGAEYLFVLRRIFLIGGWVVESAVLIACHSEGSIKSGSHLNNINYNSCYK